MVASTKLPVLSTSRRRAEKICFHRPFFDQFVKRLKMVFQLPNRSGRSRHGVPVFKR